MTSDCCALYRMCTAGSEDCSPPQQQLYDHLLRTIAISVQAGCMLIALLLIFVVFRYRKYKVRISSQSGTAQNNFIESERRRCNC